MTQPQNESFDESFIFLEEITLKSKNSPEFTLTGVSVLSPSEQEVVSTENRPLVRPLCFESRFAPPVTFFFRIVLTAFGLPIPAIIAVKLSSDGLGFAST